MTSMGPIASHLAELIAAQRGTEVRMEPKPRPEGLKEPWHAGYNPVTDATPVVRFGATWVREGRWQTADGLLMDANGALVDPDECPGCGSTPGNDMSMWVKARPENPFAPAWQFDWTYCRVCTPMQKRAELPERRPGPSRRGGKS